MTGGFRKEALGDLLEFFNGRVPSLNDHGDYPVYGSNGVIGNSEMANYENAIILGRVAHTAVRSHAAGRSSGRQTIQSSRAQKQTSTLISSTICCSGRRSIAMLVAPLNH